MGPFNVMIARFPGNYQEHPASSDYIINLMESLIRDERIDKIKSWYLSDTPITMVRNLAAKTALAEGYHYLLMIDSDMQPDIELPSGKAFWPTAWEFMMSRRTRESVESALPDADPDLLRQWFAPATIAAPYCGAAPNEQCVVFEWGNTESDSANPNFRLQYVPREVAATKKGIEEVPALPTGLILYDTRVFQQLDAPWFSYEWHDKYQSAKKTTEDVFQTRNASLAGLPQFVAWDCWAAHHKLKVVGKPKPLTLGGVRTMFGDAVVRFRSKSEEVTIATK